MPAYRTDVNVLELHVYGARGTIILEYFIVKKRVSRTYYKQWCRIHSYKLNVRGFVSFHLNCNRCDVSNSEIFFKHSTLSVYSIHLNSSGQSSAAT